MAILRDYQEAAVKNMRNGCVLVGGVGSGKSRTGLAYYFTQQGGELDPYMPMDDLDKKKLYIITTARKRDTLEWEGELIPFLIDPDDVEIDSWNNIKKYQDVRDAFFIFDEQRVVGYGTWTKAFLKIARWNDWILLSATPGDTWLDYAPIFIANGFYRNMSDFKHEHCVYSYYGSYPKLERYLNTGRLIRFRNRILVDMDFKRETISHNEDIYCRYDVSTYHDVMRNRWDPYRNEPIDNASGLCYILRRVVNSDESRQCALLDICADHKRVIVFYNFDYELDILRSLCYINDGDRMDIAEWNGHKHQPIPNSDKWVYLVQYTSGCEGWNCIKSDTIVFFSQNYSFKVMEQASGRINRMNTPYKELYYYHLKTRSGIDLAISKALSHKRKFNEFKFAEGRKQI